MHASATPTLVRALERPFSHPDHDSAAAVRLRISRELHDGPTQDLALAALALDRLIGSLEGHQTALGDARLARDLIDQAVLGMRAAIGRLRLPPPAPSITGPLRALVEEMAPSTPALDVAFQDVSGIHLPAEVERALIGIVREALHNVRKHANADRVHLEIRRVDQALEVAVVDDGIGFSGARPDGHFGLDQIRELAEETGGRLDVASETGGGTTIRAWIPLRHAATGRPAMG